MTRMTPLTAILLSKLFGGGGGSVTPDSIVTATSQMTSQQAADTLDNLGGASKSDTFPSEAKQAILDCFANVAWSDGQGQSRYNALLEALYPSENLVSISAAYTQSGTVYTNDELDSLKSDLVVTATYIGNATRILQDSEYTLSGSLNVGTSTITVTYEGKTTTFTVEVTQYVSNLLHSWDLTQSLTDSVGGIVAVTTGTLDSSGLAFTASQQYADFGEVYGADKTYELDVSTIDGPTYYPKRVLMADTDPNTAYGGGSGLIIRNNAAGRWQIYTGSGWATITDSQFDGIDFLNGKTLRVYVDSDMIWHFYTKTTGSADPFVSAGYSSSALRTYTSPHLYIGGSKDDYIYPSVFTGLRVYEGQVT